MHNPTSLELDELQEAAIVRGDDALAAYEGYTSALAEYDEAVDENEDLLPYEAAVERTRRDLDRWLVTQ